MTNKVIIIGAGPAGLTAGFLLSQNKFSVTVLEADPKYVGGISRTVTHKDYCFDIGGHRFFSKSKEVEDFWSEILPNDMLDRPRSSRIFYKNKFFSYPLNAGEVLKKLGIIESIRCFISYISSRLMPIKPVVSFRDWVCNRFGKRLFSIFFKTYTEKVWGMKCEEISADWAAQRIQKLSFWVAMLNALRGNKASNTIKTLIDTFRYPRKGPGMLWEACATKMVALGAKLELDAQVTDCHYDQKTKVWTVKYVTSQGERSLQADHVISSAPLKNLVLDYLYPPVSTLTYQAAEKLRYRDFLIVVLILKEKNQFTDNWIYIHDPNVDVARIQNFKSWSPEMVPVATTACYGMEYFCFSDEAFWHANDATLISKAQAELIQVGLATEDDFIEGVVVRQSKAYPIYDENYQTNVELIRQELTTNYPQLHLVGRNGMHKYNNQDHAIMTAMLVVKNIIAGKTLYDVWQVNQDAEYLEAGTSGNQAITERLVPAKLN